MDKTKENRQEVDDWKTGFKCELFYEEVAYGRKKYGYGDQKFYRSWRNFDNVENT